MLSNPGREKKQRDREENIVFQQWFKDDKDSSQTRGVRMQRKIPWLRTDPAEKEKKRESCKKAVCQIFPLIIFNRQHYDQ